MPVSRKIEPRILSLFGSPREKGISSTLHREFLSCFSGRAVINEVHVYQKIIHPCIACGHCRSFNGCIFFDDMTPLYDLMEDADLVTISSPVYFSSLPGPIKTMIDRFQVIWEKRRRGESRKAEGRGLFIASAGADYTGMFIPSVTVIRHLFNSMGISYDEKDFLLFTSMDTLRSGKVPEVILQRVLHTGKSYIGLYS